MKKRSMFLVFLCCVIVCGGLTVPADAARYNRKSPKKPIIVAPPPRPIIVAPRPVVVPVAPRVVPPRAGAQASYGPTFGIAGGYLAGGCTGALLEVRFPDPFQFASTSGGLGVAYATGDDTAGTNRANTLAFINGYYHFTERSAQGMRSYIGAGANYTISSVSTAFGSQSGTVGGQVFYGVEAGAPGGQIYGEVGYSMIRTGVSPSYKGLNAIVGFKM